MAAPTTGVDMDAAHAAPDASALVGSIESEPRHAGLSERDAKVLAFERQWWKFAGAKEEKIRELFGMSATRYYQVLNDLIDRPEAIVADPMLVKRLRRMRDQRQRQRAARRLGFDA